MFLFFAHIQRILIICWIFIASPILIADPSNPSFNVGDSSLILRAPDGFFEITQISQHDRNLFEAVTPSSQRLLGVFYTESDLGHVMKQEEPALDKYILVKSIRRGENSKMSESEFEKLKVYAETNVGIVADSLSSELSNILRIEDASVDLDEVARLVQQIGVGQIVPLGKFNESPRSLSMAMLVRYAQDDSSSYVMAIANTYLLAKGKLLSVDVYKIYKAQNDLDWVREFSSAWMNTLQVH